MNRHIAAPAERKTSSDLGAAQPSGDLLSDDPDAALCVSRFRVGGVCVQLEGTRRCDVTLVPSLKPFRVVKSNPDITIQVQWVAKLSPASGSKLFDSGSVWRLHEDETGFQFDFSSPILGARPYKKLVVDRHFSQATLQMSEEAFAGFPQVAEPLEYPLDELLIMHRLTQEKAIELHGVGIVGPDSATNLFVGHSGAGKSTIARLWTKLHNIEILSDDRIIVRQDMVRQDMVREDEVRKGNAREDANRIFMYGTPWHGEAAFALPGRAPLQRIFVLEHGQGNVLTRLSQGQAVGELFARSFVPFHRHGYVDSALAFLQRVASSIPCYRYAFEPDERAVEKVLNFRD
jgi:hypothetical protein